MGWADLMSTQTERPSKQRDIAFSVVCTSILAAFVIGSIYLSTHMEAQRAAEKERLQAIWCEVFSQAKQQGRLTPSEQYQFRLQCHLER
jgi:hypothetical protein